MTYIALNFQVPSSNDLRDTCFQSIGPLGFVSDLFESCLKSLRNFFYLFFFADFALQNMVETTLPDGLETSGRRAYC